MTTKSSNINTNPTAFFLNQATDTSPGTREKINEYVNRLINLKSCVLCKNDYDFTARIPRILVHCGHTICTTCLKNFHTNRRVRCPLCLKLIKNIDTLDRLPVNHTIFSKMMEERKDEFYRVSGKQGKFSDFTKTSIPNRDKRERNIDSGAVYQPTMAAMVKPDPDYLSKELFEPVRFDQAEIKKQMDWNFSKNGVMDPEMKDKLMEFQNLFERDEGAYEEDVDGNILDKKFEVPEFDFGNFFSFFHLKI